MAIYRSMTAQRVQQFASALADGRSVAHLANGRAAVKSAPVATPPVLASVSTGAVGGELAIRDRVTDAEVVARQDWMRAACEYAEKYTGDFSFMVDMRTAMRRNSGLSIPQMRGTLNCMRAEAQRIIENAKRAEAAKPVTQPTTETPTLGDVADGFYTVKFDDGSHVTLRINSLSAKQSRDGRPHRYASYLCGPINTLDYSRFAEIKGQTYRSWNSTHAKQRAALEILMSAGAKKQTAFGKAYARAATRCYRCGKLLTEPESIEAGIGPICAGRE